jgi:fructokinase
VSDHALVIGEALVDVVISVDGSAEVHPGGSPANVAIGLGRLGRDVELLAYLAEDDNGAIVREHLAASQVALASGTLGAPRTSVATAHLDESGAATYDFDLEWAIADGAEPRPEPLVVHTGSIAAVLAPGAEAVRSLVASLRHGAGNSGATVTYDPNARPSLMGSPQDARKAIESMVALSDVVKVSDEDLAWLASTDDVDSVAKGWLDLGPAFVVVTRGGSGATAFLRGDRSVHVDAPRVEVADTVGAGDSFMGGLIDGLWSADVLGGDRREALRQIPDATLVAILERCARIAAITVSRPGANPPGSAELDVAPEDTQP